MGAVIGYLFVAIVFLIVALVLLKGILAFLNIIGIIVKCPSCKQWISKSLLRCSKCGFVRPS
jgi:hypothetical protein